MDNHADMAAAYQAGASLKQIAEQFGCAASTARERLARAGVAIRPAGVHLTKQRRGEGRTRKRNADPRSADAVAAYRRGRSLRAVAHEFGCGVSTLRS